MSGKYKRNKASSERAVPCSVLQSVVPAVVHTGMIAFDLELLVAVVNIWRIMV